MSSAKIKKPNSLQLLIIAAKLFHNRKYIRKNNINSTEEFKNLYNLAREYTVTPIGIAAYGLLRHLKSGDINTLPVSLVNRIKAFMSDPLVNIGIIAGLAIAVYESTTPLANALSTPEIVYGLLQQTALNFTGNFAVYYNKIKSNTTQTTQIFDKVIQCVCNGICTLNTTQTNAASYYQGQSIRYNAFSEPATAVFLTTCSMIFYVFCNLIYNIIVACT